MMELTRAFTLSVPDEEAIRIRDDVNFFPDGSGGDPEEGAQ